MKNIRQLGNGTLLLLTALIWGVAFVAQCVGMDYIGPFTFNCIRFLIGGVVLLPVIAVMHKKKRGVKEQNNVQEETAQKETDQASKEYRRNTILGGICCGFFLCMGSTFQQFGIIQTSVGKAGFITALYIVIVPLLGVFFKKKINGLLLIATGIALCGFYFLCISEKTGINQGDLLLLVCSVLFSFHILVIDYFSPKGDAVQISCIQFFTSGVISAIGMLLFEKPDLAAILTAYIPILYAGIMSCGVAYTLQIVGQKNMNPTVASLILCLESVFSVLAGWLILGQKLSLRETIGCILVFCAVILAQLPMRAKKQKTVE